MSEMSLNDAYRCLDLPPEATLLQVERTYRHKRTLFAEENLATYALFDESLRRQHLTRLETAYQRICGSGPGDLREREKTAVIVGRWPRPALPPIRFSPPVASCASGGRPPA